MAGGPERLTAHAGDAGVPVVLCVPRGAGPHPLVLVFHGSDGFGPQHVLAARLLARSGFAAAVPEWFGATPARASWGDLRPGDLEAVVAEAGRRPGVDPHRLAVMGFSRGGGAALLAATVLPGVRGVVNYFGLTAWERGLGEYRHFRLDPADPLGLVARIPCPVLSFHGDRDDIVPVGNTLALDEACRRHGVGHRVVIYPGVGHSFVWPGNPLHDPRAHRHSWMLALEFLRERLGLERPVGAERGGRR